MNQHIIVYHSQMQADADAFWTAHPGILLAGMAILFGLPVLFILASMIRRLFGKRMPLHQRRWPGSF